MLILTKSYLCYINTHIYIYLTYKIIDLKLKIKLKYVNQPTYLNI